MTSLLSRQLEAHRASNPLPPPKDAKKSRPTILFTSHQAGLLDAKQLLDLGRNGFQKLCQLSPELIRFQDLFETVLGSDSKSERHLLPQTQKLEVDSQCQMLLLGLGPHFPREYAIHVLEFLVQRYQVHVSSPDELLSCLLLQHETPLYSTVSSLVLAQHGAMQHSKWAFLAKFPRDGIQRKDLVSHAVKIPLVLDQICRITSIYFPVFFAAFSLECLQLNKEMDTVTSVLSRHVVDILKKSTAEDRRPGLTVIAGLARTVVLSLDAIHAFLRLLLKRAIKFDSDEELITCALLLYEWQVPKHQDLPIFSNPKDWNRFSESFSAVFKRALEIEIKENQPLALVTEALRQSVAQQDVESYLTQMSFSPSFSQARTSELVSLMNNAVCFQDVLQRVALESPSSLKAIDNNNAPISFSDCDQVFLALRSPNQVFRTAALSYCQKNPDQHVQVELFEAALLMVDWFLHNDIGEETTSDVLQVTKLVSFPDVEQVLPLALQSKVESVVLAVLETQPILNSNPLALFQIYHETRFDEVKKLCGQYLSATWMGNVAKSDFKASAKYLQSLPERDSLVQALCKISPQMTMDMISNMKDDASQLIFSMLLRYSAKPSLNLSILVKQLLKHKALSQLCLELVQASPICWPNCYPVFAEGLKTLSKSRDVYAFLLDLLVDLEEEVSLIRILRMLLWTTSPQVEESKWLCLLPSLQHEKNGEVRVLALQVLHQNQPKHVLHVALLNRQEELKRDAKTLIRALGMPKSAARTYLAKLASQEKPAPISSSLVRSIVSLLQDEVLARNVLKTKTEDSRVVAACLEVLSNRTAGEEDDLVILKRGVASPHVSLYLQWALLFSSWTSKANIGLFVELVAMVESYPVALDVVSKLKFEESDLCSLLAKINTIDKPREVQVLVECIAAHGFFTCSMFAQYFRLLALSRRFGILEHALVVGVERNAANFQEEKESVLCSVLEEMTHATRLISRLAATRAFCLMTPPCSFFSQAFERITEFALFEKLVHALSLCKEKENDVLLVHVIPSLCRRYRTLLPRPQHLDVLLDISSKFPMARGVVIRQWLEEDLVEASQLMKDLDAQVQTETLISLMKQEASSSHTSKVSMFVSRHLRSKIFMASLMKHSPDDALCFIHLFETLMDSLVRVGNEEEEQVLELALERLSVLLSLHVFLPVMEEILHPRQEFKVRALAVKLLKSKINDEHREWHKAERKYVMEFVLGLRKWLEADAKDMHTLLSINSLAVVLAEYHARVFVDLIPVLMLSLDDEKEVSAVASALLCLGTICNKVREHALKHVNGVVSRIVSLCLQDYGEEEVALKSALIRPAGLHALKEIVDAGLALDFTELLPVLRLQDEGVEDLIESLGRVMDPKLGILVCTQSLTENQEEDDVRGLLQLTLVICQRLTAFCAFEDLLALCKACCLHDGESALVVSIVVHVFLLLSESKLKQVLHSLVASSKGHVSILLHTIGGLVKKCGSLVLPVLPMEFILMHLTRSQPDTQRVVKRVKLDDEKEEDQESNAAALGVIGEILLHAQGTSFVNATIFESILNAVLLLLSDCSPAASSRKEEAQQVLASLAQSILSHTSVNAMLQTLHHAVTKLLKSSEAEVRLAGISTVKCLFERVGPDYLALLPDTLPFLAELLEDREESIRITAQRVALVLKELSGEEISEFLK